MTKNKKLIIALLVVIALLVAGIYVRGVFYYQTHFYKGTVLKSFNCPNMTVEEARHAIEIGVKKYSFTIYENNGVSETIEGNEIDFSASNIKGIEKALSNQNPYKWFFNSKAKYQDIGIDITFDKNKLYNKVLSLKCIDKAMDQLRTVPSHIVFDEKSGAFTVEDKGINTDDIISQKCLYEKAKGAIECMYPDMDLKIDGVYCDASRDDTISAILQELNLHVASEIQYLKGTADFEILNKSQIAKWYSVDDTFNIVFENSAVEAYVKALATRFDTSNHNYAFTTTDGNPITVSGGDFGWVINQPNEVKAIINGLSIGEKTSREPALTRRPYNNSEKIEDSYVEVSIDAQHLWMYKKGALVVETSVVTGNVLNGNGTATGVYTLKYKAKNTVLRGEDYETPVSYWMPFHGGQGLHDATWRGVFGGQIYRGGGSHGCVNIPPIKAKIIYDNIETSYPIVVY